MTTDDPVVPDAPRHRDEEDDDFFIVGIKRLDAHERKPGINRGKYLMRSAMEAVDEMPSIGRNVDPWVGVFSSDKDAFLDLYGEVGNFDAVGGLRHYDDIKHYPHLKELKDCGHDAVAYVRLSDLRGVLRIAPCLLPPGDTGVYIGQTLGADERGDGHLQEAKRHPDRKSSQAANAAKGKKTLALVRVQQSKFKSFAAGIEKAFPALRPLQERVFGYPPTPRQIVQVFLLAVEAYHAAIFRAYRKHILYNEILDEHPGEIDVSLIGLNGNGCLSSGLVDDSRVAAASASRAIALATFFQPRAVASVPSPASAPRPSAGPPSPPAPQQQAASTSRAAVLPSTARAGFSPSMSGRSQATAAAEALAAQQAAENAHPLAAARARALLKTMKQGGIYWSLRYVLQALYEHLDIKSSRASHLDDVHAVVADSRALNL